MYSGSCKKGEVTVDCKLCRKCFLELPYCHAILASLLYNGKQKKTALITSISKSSCMQKRVDLLEKQGIIKITVDRFDKNTKWVELTDRGEIIAEHVLEACRSLMCGVQSQNVNHL